MYFKLLSILLAVLLVVESAFLYLHRPAPNRFRAVDGYGGLVAFDTATGQLCKTLKMKSAAEIEAESKQNRSTKCQRQSPKRTFCGFGATLSWPRVIGLSQRGNRLASQLFLFRHQIVRNLWNHPLTSSRLSIAVAL
jgi:hypothetical protein